jgi:hypothetical protein
VPPPSKWHTSHYTHAVPNAHRLHNTRHGGQRRRSPPINWSS